MLKSLPSVSVDYRLQLRETGFAWFAGNRMLYVVPEACRHRDMTFTTNLRVTHSPDNMLSTLHLEGRPREPRGLCYSLHAGILELGGIPAEPPKVLDIQLRVEGYYTEHIRPRLSSSKREEVGDFHRDARTFLRHMFQPIPQFAWDGVLDTVYGPRA